MLPTLSLSLSFNFVAEFEENSRKLPFCWWVVGVFCVDSLLRYFHLFFVPPNAIRQRSFTSSFACFLSLSLSLLFLSCLCTLPSATTLFLLLDGMRVVINVVLRPFGMSLCCIVIFFMFFCRSLPCLRKLYGRTTRRKDDDKTISSYCCWQLKYLGTAWTA